jgi:dCTP deaminase
MILTDGDILKAHDCGDIQIEPFDRERLGTNSYDVTLGKTLLVYSAPMGVALDSAKENRTDEITIPPEGFVVLPGVLYLGVTNECAGSRKYVPYLEGKSSGGRLGLFIHATAGKGDVKFYNYWTMEISVVQPLRLYAGMPIGQLTFFQVTSPPIVSYADKVGAKYNDISPRPQASRMWKNFPLKG